MVTKLLMTSVSTDVKLSVDPESEDLLQADRMVQQNKADETIIDEVRVFILVFLLLFMIV